MIINQYYSKTQLFIPNRLIPKTHFRPKSSYASLPPGGRILDTRSLMVHQLSYEMNIRNDDDIFFSDLAPSGEVKQGSTLLSTILARWLNILPPFLEQRRTSKCRLMLGLSMVRSN